MINKEIIKSLIKEGYLITPELAESINESEDKDSILELISKLKDKPIILTENLIKINIENYYPNQENQSKSINNVIIAKSYKENTKKIDVQDFVNNFRARYNFLKDILMNRLELQDSLSINKLYNKQEREKVSIIGMVVKKETTKNSNILITIEDFTGTINILVNKNKNIYNVAKDIVLDEVIGITGVFGKSIVFVDEIYFPDIPNKELKKIDEDVYVAFTSDIHVGLYAFQEKNFIKFLKWLNGEYGDANQKELSKKVRYLILTGDLVEGVGVYPNHEKDLVIKDIYKQYERLAELLSMVPKSINIVLCGGNHDALRIAEPQPELYKDLAKPLWDLSNVKITTNPSLVNIHSSKDFPGFNILMYHGFSIPYYSTNVDSIRLAGGLNKVDIIMKLFLQRRHLAPSHTSTLYIPSGTNEDPLLIDTVPDFFVTGHVHKVVATNYKSVSMICSGCWVTQTSYQERRGLVPESFKIILASLKTREFRILNFEE